MSVSVSMPQLGESVTEGTVTRWLKREGEHVQADEPLLEVSTDKVDTEIPSPVSGVLRGITVAEDETVAVGAELAVIDEDGAAGGQPAAAPAQAAAPAAVAPEVPSPAPAQEAAQVAPAEAWPAEPEPVPAPPAAISSRPQATSPPAPSYQPPAPSHRLRATGTTSRRHTSHRPRATKPRRPQPPRRRPPQRPRRRAGTAVLSAGRSFVCPGCRLRRR